MNTVRFKGRDISPSKVVCIARNYAAHISELANTRPDQMAVFIKPNSAITNSLSTAGPQAIHYEGEICFICQAGSFSGVAFGLDLTKRDLQDSLRKQGLPWERSKAFDGSALFSEFVPIVSVAGPFSVELRINGMIVQSADSSLMLYQPSTIITEITAFMSLCDGDVVMTGTPAGVGPIRSGDVLKGTVSQDGRTLASAEWLAS